MKTPGAVADDITIMAVLFLACASVRYESKTATPAAEVMTDVTSCSSETSNLTKFTRAAFALWSLSVAAWTIWAITVEPSVH